MIHKADKVHKGDMVHKVDKEALGDRQQLEMCQYDTDVPPRAATLTHTQTFCKKWSRKKGQNSHNTSIWQILP